METNLTHLPSKIPMPYVLHQISCFASKISIKYYN